MTAPPTLPVEQAAEGHAQHIVRGDSTAMHQDCTAQMRQEPPDLYAQLCAATFARYHIRCAYLPTSSPVARRLSAVGWTTLYRDADWVVFTD